MTECHPLLHRQLRRLGLEDAVAPSPEMWAAVVRTISRTYSDADQDRYTMERSLSISSRELRELYDDLKRSSETRLAQERDKLRENNQFLDSVFENIPNMVFVKDALTLRFVRFNRAGEELVGVESEDLIGKSDHDLFPHDQANFFVSRDREVLSQRGVMVIEDEQLQTKLHGVRRLKTKKIPISDRNGVPKYLLGISEDMTDARRQESELLDAKETAERASRAKSDFLANMSHELRTPLNSILGFARVLDRTLEATLTAEQREFFKYITHASEHMLRLVNDLLDLRTADETKLVVGNVDLAPVVREAADLVQPLVNEKRIKLALDIPGTIPSAIGERGAMVQVLINLLSNAIKFTPEDGFIDIAMVQDGSSVRLSVKDSGIGIRHCDQARLFTYFEQLGAKHEHNMKGSGIGLALTKALVMKQGGSIRVDSAPGVGSTFTVSLQVAS